MDWIKLNYEYLETNAQFLSKEFDDKLDMFRLSFDHLKNHEIEADELLKNFDIHLKAVWKLRSSFLGNLEDCIKKVLQKSKENVINATEVDGKGSVSETQKLNDYKTKMKIAILAIERLSEDQLLPENEKPRHGFKGSLLNYLLFFFNKVYKSIANTNSF